MIDINQEENKVGNLRICEISSGLFTGFITLVDIGTVKSVEDIINIVIMRLHNILAKNNFQKLLRKVEFSTWEINTPLDFIIKNNVVVRIFNY